MSGAEVVQLVSACIDLTKAIVTIAQTAKDSQGLPPKVSRLFEELPAVQSLFQRALQHNVDLKIQQDTQPGVALVLKHCEQDLQTMNQLFEKICPKVGANSLQRTWKGTSAIVSGKDIKLQDLWTSIRNHLDTLETKHILDIGDQLDDLTKIVRSLADEREATNQYSVAGSMYQINGGTMFHNSGDQATNYQAGGSQSFVFNNRST